LVTRQQVVGFRWQHIIIRHLQVMSSSGKVRKRVFNSFRVFVFVSMQKTLPALKRMQLGINVFSLSFAHEINYDHGRAESTLLVQNIILILMIQKLSAFMKEEN
jgi:hypothetical protein